MTSSQAAYPAIRIRGARQHSLKNLDIDLPLHALTVITGVSGSGKSSLAFDTVFAEAQRRYIETFSAYARQFLDRMDQPHVDQVANVPPGIAVSQTNPVRTSRSTVGTMSELNDHLKLLMARFATPYCSGCGQSVKRDHSEDVAATLLRCAPDQRIAVLFSLPIPEALGPEKLLNWLDTQGFTKVYQQSDTHVTLIQDRLRLSADNASRLSEALESAFRLGSGDIQIGYYNDAREISRLESFSEHFHCAECDISYRRLGPNDFSFNSPLGACDSCRGFGRTIGIDYQLVIPDQRLSLKAGCVKPWQTKTNAFCQRDLLTHAARRGIDLDTPWAELSTADQQWVIEGDGPWDGEHWYGLTRFFDYLESQAYKMHIRVLLSKYRSYSPCQTCQGARLKPESLLWRLGDQALSDALLGDKPRYRHPSVQCDETRWQQLPGLCLHDIMQLPLSHALRFFQQLPLATERDKASAQLLLEINTRLGYLNTVGLHYLSLDRQSRSLSGGEVQRINLTTALGTSLVNTLFVLDEPSIGLHPRDMDRVIQIMRKLQQAGNTLLVVEHDPQVMLAADYVLDMGPGAGPNGGQIQYFGQAKALIEAKNSLTADYLRGDKTLDQSQHRRPPSEQHIDLRGACGHNLKQVDFRLPLKQLVCVTGVSGSGKSTLIQDTLCHAILQHLGQTQQSPEPFSTLEGLEHIDSLALVDQSAIGKTTRSNTASYTGAFDSIRQCFAKHPLAKERDYSAGSFSFNSRMKCPSCGGNGFEHVEMQFLSDVYLRCDSCNGSRYQREVLDVKHTGANGQQAHIAEVLAMTTTEALAFFADQPKVCRALQPLIDVGLDYLSLGQAVPTLSGGEAQRLKLAAHLVEHQKTRKGQKKHTLFVFDEPTTGLHFADIAKLLGAFNTLLDAGHSVLVIEHNIDVMLAADHLIDLGPEGGDEGGQIIAEGSPEQLAQHPTSHTARAIRDYRQALEHKQLAQIAEPSSDYRSDGSVAHQQIVLQNAREHNLRGIDVSIPHDTFTVISGLSGSGKSTLAFDILYAEGQRRYLESLNAYARQFVQPPSRPQIDSLTGMPPTVAIEQRTSRGGRKSTVATLTEIHHYLRVLMVNLGQRYCPDCQVPVSSTHADELLSQIQRRYAGRSIALLAPLVTGRKGYYKELASWAAQKGYVALRVDGQLTPVDPWPKLDRYNEHDIELPVTEITVGKNARDALAQALNTTLALGKNRCLVVDQQSGESALFSANHTCESCGQGFDELDPRLFSYNSSQGWCTRCYGTGELLEDFDPEAQSGEEAAFQDRALESIGCPDCHGARLNPVACAVRFKGQTLPELSRLSLSAAAKHFASLTLNKREKAIANDVLSNIQKRLGFLLQLGLDYLSLDRSAPSLSGGEAQRIRLAAQLGSHLNGVAYVLDEPTIGLHPRDNAKLLNTLKQLRAQGNTVIVVEHDEDTLLAAEHLIDLGPGAGTRGGYVVAEGTPKAVMKNPDSLTGRCLAKQSMPDEARNLTPATEWLGIQQAQHHNLQSLDLRLPLKRLVGISGVSGSGKSTLVHEVIKHDWLRLQAGQHPQRCQAIEHWQQVERLLEVDQTPIGKTPRSCPATYLGIFDHIRKAFANTQDAALRGFSARRFSFNTAGGRCEACDGQGQVNVEMSFLPNVKVPCELCKGQRFKQETLAVKYKGRSIAEVLSMAVDEAAEFFAAHPAIHHPLSLLQAVGLGYLTLGQQSPTLSGGEAQRIKLVTELAKARVGGVPRRGKQQQHHLYLLDEPTVGLHMADVAKLAQLLRRLVDAGHSVVVIEHNLALLSACDHLIELGPEGGEHGGQLIAEGSVEAICQHPHSQTGPYLKSALKGALNS